MSVTAFHEAMQHRLTDLGLPVYAEGHVPDSARYPYMTWNCGLKPGSEGSLMIRGWFRSDHLACLGLADSLLNLLPYMPGALAINGGFALLRAEEISIQADAADTSVEACCLRASVRLYPCAGEDDAW